MNGQRFEFHGYLPVDTRERARRLRELEAEAARSSATQIFIETPYRNETLYQAILDHCRAAHVSAEAGHRLLLHELGLRPLLDLDMRLGEASGAVAALAVLRLAAAVHDGMQTFAEAGVSTA